MKRMMKKTRGPVLFRWFTSYLAILLIPLLFSAAVYSFSLYSINKSSEEIYAASLEQLRIETDNFISSTFQTLEQLALNTDIQVLTRVRGDLAPRDQWNVIQAVNEIRKIQIIFPLIDEIFVVLNPLDAVLTSSAYFPLDLYYHLFFQDENLGLDDFVSLIANPRANEMIRVKDKFLFFQASTEGFLGDKSATLAVSYRTELFRRRFINSFEVNGGRIFFVPHNPPESRVGPGPGVSDFPLDPQSYRVFTVKSQVMDFSYHYYVPRNLETARARRIQIFTFAGLLACTLLGLFLAFHLSRRHYDPVRKLMAVFRGQENLSKGEDEFRWMERRAIDTQTALGRSFKTLRRYYVHTLLEKPFDPVAGKSEMERYNIRLEGEWNLVIVFTIPIFPKEGMTLTENEGDIISVLQYVIMHIFTESAGRDFSVEVTDIGEHVAAIVDWSGGGGDAFISRLEDHIEYTQQETGEFLHFPVLTSLGEPRRGPEGIYYSYLEALETLRYLDPKTGQTILHYHDIRDGGGYRFTLEMEQKLVNLVRSGDSEAACGLLRQIWSENNDPVPGRMSRLLAYNLLGSLIRGMEPGPWLLSADGRTDGKADAVAPDDLLSCGFNLENVPPPELAGVLERTALEICRSNSLFRRERPERQLSGKVKKYIEENYKNPNLNISITSYHFNMNPAYLAAVFKEDTGTGLLEYINTLRIEEGKKLLRLGREVNEAAEESGFRSSGTFIRVFKKLTGLTPGQFREL